jgi:hypothetical protein
MSSDSNEEEIKEWSITQQQDGVKEYRATLKNGSPVEHVESSGPTNLAQGAREPRWVQIIKDMECSNSSKQTKTNEKKTE